MLSEHDAKRLLHDPACSAAADKLLVLLAIEPAEPMVVKEVKLRGKKAGWPGIVKLNVSLSLSRTEGRAIRTDAGWELGDSGKKRVAELSALLPGNRVILNTSNSLRAHLARISDPLCRDFVNEAVICFEAKQYRAAVVFSWAGAIALLHKHVFDHHLGAFNAEATRREPKWKQAKQQDDLGRMGENDFLNVCESIGVAGLGNNVKSLLQNNCLKLRNTCGHPNSAQIAENSAAAHIEKLILNVFTKF